jgi:transcriptional regulator with GAF, ATPase, and Fis domain
MDSQRALILQALEAAGWVIGRPVGAAARLGLKRTTLLSKMKKLGVSRRSRQNNAQLSENREGETWAQPAAD